MIGAAPITPPDISLIDPEEVEFLLSELKALWGWKRDVDADIFFGWVAAASLGGFTNTDRQAFLARVDAKGNFYRKGGA